MAIDTLTLDQFMGRFVGDLCAVMHADTVVVGDQHGLYKALAQGFCGAEALARRTACDERYARKWLRFQAASGYVQYGAFKRLSPLRLHRPSAAALLLGPGAHAKSKRSRFITLFQADTKSRTKICGASLHA